jgi:hypothetical protein
VCGIPQQAKGGAGDGWLLAGAGALPAVVLPAHPVPVLIPSFRLSYMCCAPIRYGPAANRFQIDFLTKNSCYENTVLFAQYATLIQIKLQ